MMEYWIAVLITSLVWCAIFILLPRNRKEMLITALLLTPSVIVDVITVPEYWSPKTTFNIPVGIEAFFFTFFISGIAAVCAKLILGESKKKLVKFQLKKLVYFSPALVISFFTWQIFKFNGMIAVILCMALVNVTMLFSRKDLIRNFLYSSIIFSILYVAAYCLWLLICPECKDWWNKDEIIGYAWVMPYEEIFFALMLGGAAGIIYEYLFERSK